MVHKQKFENQVDQTMGERKAWFAFTVLYLLVEFARIQDLLKIGQLRPGLIISVILIFYIFKNANLYIHIKQIKLIYAFFILICVFVVFARNNYYAYRTARGFFLFLPFILSTVICVNTVDRLKRFINWWILFTAYVALYSIFHHGKGSGGWFNDENDLSLFLNTMLPFVYYQFFYEKMSVKKLLFIGTIFICLVAEVISFSRGGFLGLLAVVFSIVFFSKNRIKGFALICFFAILMSIFAGTRYWSEIKTISDTKSGTAQTRIQMWKSALTMFMDNPLGVGGNNFQVRFDEYQTAHFKKGMWGRPAHSLWFTLLSELGIFGSLIYLLLLRSNIKDIWYLKRLKTDNDDFRFLNTLSLAIIASLVGYFVSGTFLSVLYYPYYWYITGLIVASVLIAKRLENSKEIC
jgi:hypothetical protein